MSDSVLIAGSGTTRMSREDLALIPAPLATATHKPIAHIQIISALIETLGFRHIKVVNDEYAVSSGGMRMFGLLELDYEFTGCRFAIGIRNANDRSMRLALTVGYKVLVCSNMAFKGDFSPLIAKHSKNFDLIDALSIGVDRIQRGFQPLQNTVENWRIQNLSNDEARVVIYEAFVEGKLAASPKIMKSVHRHYFLPEYEEFKARSLFSLSNAFTSAFKELKPEKQFSATAKLPAFLSRYVKPF